MDRLLKVLRTLLPALLVTGLAAAATSSAVPAYLAAAIADPSRPAEDVARDADRKPAETLHVRRRRARRDRSRSCCPAEAISPAS